MEVNKSHQSWASWVCCVQKHKVYLKKNRIKKSWSGEMSPGCKSEACPWLNKSCFLKSIIYQCWFKSECSSLWFWFCFRSFQTRFHRFSLAEICSWCVCLKEDLRKPICILQALCQHWLLFGFRHSCEEHFPLQNHGILNTHWPICKIQYQMKLVLFFLSDLFNFPAWSQF